MDLQTLREHHFTFFADSCKRMGGTYRKESDNVHYCDLTPDLTIEFALPKDTLYGRFTLRKRETSRARIGVIFDQRTLTVI